MWIADATDPEEAYIVERLRHVYILTDSNGKVLEHSQTYDSIGIDSPQEIVRILRLPQPEIHVRRDADGVPYMIKAGSMRGDKGRLYFFALGRSIESNERTLANFMRRYFLLLPGMIFITGLLGWALAGRAIRPLNLVAATAQEITGSNLSLSIPRRNADDELDNLIDSFNRMTARLSQSFEQIRQFSTDVSHELRTPLTAIRGQLEVALFTAEKPEQFRDAMVNALEDVEKLSSIVRALLLLVAGGIGTTGAAENAARSGRSGGGCGGSVPDSGRGKERQFNGYAGAGLGCERRPDADGAHDFEPALERDEIHAQGRQGARARGAGSRRGLDPAGSGRQRRGHSRRKSAAHFRPLLPRAQRADQQHARAWDWA